MSNKCLGAVLACLLTLATFAGFAVWNSHAPMAQDDFYFTTMVPDGDMEAFTYCEGRPIESFGDALANVVNVFLYDFGRCLIFCIFCLCRFRPWRSGCSMPWYSRWCFG